MQNETTPQNGNSLAISIPQLTLQLPDVTARASAAKVAVDHHRAYVNTIDCAEGHQLVAEQLTEIKRQLNEVRAEVAEQKKPFQEIKKICQNAMDRIDRQFEGLQQYLILSETLLKGEVGRWLRLEEARKTREEQEERQRREAEARRIADEAARIQAETAAAAREKQEQAQAAATNGDLRVANQLRTEAETIVRRGTEETQLRIEEATAVRESPVVATKHATTRVKGQSLSHSYEAVLVDMDAAIRGVLDGSIPKTDILKGKPVQIVQFDMKWFRAEAIRLGSHFAYPGFEARPTTNMKVRV